MHVTKNCYSMCVSVRYYVRQFSRGPPLSHRLPLLLSLHSISLQMCADGATLRLPLCPPPRAFSSQICATCSRDFLAQHMYNIHWQPSSRAVTLLSQLHRHVFTFSLPPFPLQTSKELLPHLNRTPKNEGRDDNALHCGDGRCSDLRTNQVPEVRHG